MAEHYCLRWNNHHPNFITVFKSLLELEELVDVTLSVEGKHIKAHKVILSACSPYFKLLFTMTTCKHPIVILSDIKYEDLKIIIDFMYCGEINISDEQLADILEIAEVLQVRGLFDPNNKPMSEKNCVPPTKKRKRQYEATAINSLPQNNIMSQHRFEEHISVGTVPGEKVVKVTERLETNDYSHDNGSISIFQPNVSLKEEDTPNLSAEENKSCSIIFDQSVKNISPHTLRPVSDPGLTRRRNSKVQESENFLLALEAVRSGSIGFCKAAKLYGLNNRTLWLEYKKRGYPTTRPPVGLRNRSNAVPGIPS